MGKFDKSTLSRDSELGLMTVTLVAVAVAMVVVMHEVDSTVSMVFLRDFEILFEHLTLVPSILDTSSALHAELIGSRQMLPEFSPITLS